MSRFVGFHFQAFGETVERVVSTHIFITGADDRVTLEMWSQQSIVLTLSNSIKGHFAQINTTHFSSSSFPS